jgi:hypothetical protein
MCGVLARVLASGEAESKTISLSNQNLCDWKKIIKGSLADYHL